MWLLGTVLDGDCAIDVMTQMAGLPSTYGSRCKVRRNISDYLIERAGVPWMRYLMVVLAELEEEDVMRCGDETTVVDVEGLRSSSWSHMPQHPQLRKTTRLLSMWSAPKSPVRN